MNDFELLKTEFLPPRKKNAHKGDFGKALIIGGDSGMIGAVTLAASAALRVGAGITRVATRCQHAKFISITTPEIMAHGVKNKKDLQKLMEKSTVLAIGPGLGTSDWAQELFHIAMSTNLPLVVDADGLNLLAKNYTKRSNWILTPHPKEAARLLKQTDIIANREQTAEKIAQKYNAITVLKGSGSIITDGNKQHAICPYGNPGMASSGMGDILTGIITGLIAQGVDLFNAAKLGVYIHAKAGDCASCDGERGMLASDLLPFIKKLAN